MKRMVHFGFRWALPVAQLVLCGVLLWPWRHVYIFQLHSALHSRQPEKELILVPIISGPLDLATPRDRRARELAELSLAAPAIVNLPSAFVGLALPGSVPSGMYPEYWRSISWPIVGIIFWWIAGRGIDALLASRSRNLFPKITIAETIVALLLTGSVGLLFAGFIIDPSIRAEFILPWRLGIVSCVLWIFLGAATVVARVVQWRLRRQLRAEVRERTA